MSQSPPVYSNGLVVNINQQVRFKVVLLVFLMLAACSPDPSVEIVVGEVLLRETFGEAGGWDSNATDEVSIGIESGAYRIRANVSSFVRGFYLREPFEDVVIDVRSVQLSQYENTALGIICRGELTDRRAGGYYFLIGADGSYSIRKGMQDQVVGLLKWAHSDAINRGVATNNIRVICIGDYLALWVNGEFVAEVRDDLYQRGYVGLTAAVEAGDLIEVSFDDLIILEGALR